MIRLIKAGIIVELFFISIFLMVLRRYNVLLLRRAATPEQFTLMLPLFLYQRDKLDQNALRGRFAWSSVLGGGLRRRPQWQKDLNAAKAFCR